MITLYLARPPLILRESPKCTILTEVVNDQPGLERRAALGVIVPQAGDSQLSLNGAAWENTRHW